MLTGKRFLTNPTAGYQQSIYTFGPASAYLMNNEPWFTWGDVPLMVRDPMVRYGLRLLRVPLSRVSWTVKARQQRVADFVNMTLKGFWQRDAPRLITSYHKWGRAPGGAEYRYNALYKRIELACVRRIEPYDCETRVWSDGNRQGQFAGFVMRSAGPTSGARANTFVTAPNCFYFSGHDELAPFCDMPKIAGAFTPYLEKNSPGGIRASRRLFLWIKAVGKTIIRYPAGKVKTRDGVEIEGEDLARRFGELLQNGSVVFAPNNPNAGIDGKYAWDIEEPTGQPDTGNIRESVKDVDKEILIGLDIPPEIVSASDVGSGWSGRGIPMETWYAGADETAGMLWSAFNEQILKPLVWLNYRTLEYDVQLHSLLEAFRAEGQQGGGQGGAGGGDPSAGGGGAPASPGAPYQGPRGGRGFYGPDGKPHYTHGGGGRSGASLSSFGDIDDGTRRRLNQQARAATGIDSKTAKLRKIAAIAMLQLREEAMTAGTPDKNDDAIHAIAELVDDPDELAKALGQLPAMLSWINYGTSRSGKQRWKNTETRQVRYQKSMPGEWAAKREVARASARRARELHALAVSHQATADDLKELAQHIPALSVADLRGLKTQMMASFKNAKRRDDMVKSLIDHVEGRSVNTKKEDTLRRKIAAWKKKNSFAQAAISFGGLDAGSSEYDDGVKGQIENGVPRNVFRKRVVGRPNAHAPDTLAQELVTTGHLTVPEGRNASDYIMELIAEGAIHENADYGELYELEDQLLQQERHNALSSHTPEDIEAAVRSGEEQGVHAEASGAHHPGEEDDEYHYHGGEDDGDASFDVGALDAVAGTGTVGAGTGGADDEHAREQLAGTGGAGSQGGVSPGQPVGDVPPQGDAAQAASGVGGEPGTVPPGPDASGATPVHPDDGAGDAAADGAGTRPQRSRRKRQLGGPPRDADGVRLGGGLDGSQPALPDPTPAEESVSQPPAPENPTDASAGNYRYDSRDFFKGGLKAKFNANMAAIRTLRQIQEDGRDAATPEEQAILSKFTGWGQFPALFNDFWSDDDGKDHWAAERQALQAVMSHEDWEAAKASTINAHYTHPDVVDAHWKVAQKLGFTGGRYLETSAGIGYYLGMMPPELSQATRSTAVEMDSTTGNMLKLLYPGSNVEVKPFQKHLSPDGYYDLVASNVPFGKVVIRDDPDYKRHNANIHDYFFLKSADKVRPGGLVMHITSAGTLDKPDSKIREELAKTCDLVGAIRFPGGAHKENAGTDVVTDMVILRKRLPGEAAGDTSWTKTTTVPDPAGGDPIPVNAYFAKNPGQVLGTLDRTGSMYQGESVNVSKTADYEHRLQAAVAALPANVMTAQKSPPQRFEPEVLPAPGEVKDGGYHVQDGKLFVRDGGAMTEQKVPPATAKKIEAHLGVRDALRALLKAETMGEDGTAARAALNQVYDEFVAAHGPLNAQANKRAFLTDPDSPSVLALEKFDPKTKTASKADIFTKATVSAVKPVTKVDNVGEGVGVSLHENGRLDVNHVARLTGLPVAEVGKQLAAQGLAYDDPTEGWHPADQYLSGNVRRKLAIAKAAAANDPKYAANVAALERVQPADIHHEDIEVRLGAPWVPASDITGFAAHLLNASPDGFEIQYNPALGEWHADYGGRSGRQVAGSRTATEVWGTPKMSFVKLLGAALNGTPVRVTMADPTGGDKPVLDRAATEAAQAKVQEIKNEFKNWLWEDDERRERLHRHYNDNFNNIVTLKYQGGHQQFPGSNPAIQLRDHQKNFVWQTVTTGSGLAGHEVGTGKTYTMAAAAMELRRLGLARKPAIICKKANVDSVTEDARKLYPGAKILSTADMFDAANRKRTISRIATGDYDIVVMTHDHFDLLPVRPETQQKYIQEELDQLEEAYRDAWEASGADKNNSVVKQLAKAKLNLTEKLNAALSADKKDDAAYFEDLGIDQIFVDEAHRYKALPIYTKMRDLKGVPSSPSERASNMLMKCRTLQEKNGGRGVVFATGTPIANTMAELYNMQRYLQPQQLKERGIANFDAWVNTFADTETKMERTATGEYKPVTRLSRFVNVPELMQISRQMLDVQRADDLKRPDGSPVVVRPKRDDQLAKAPKTEAMAGVMAELQKRAAALKGRRPGESNDNMLAICNDGRKASLDMRMYDPSAEDDENSKSNQMVRKVLEVSKAHPGQTQMIFSDMGANPVQGGFHLYADIIDKLVKGGIKREEIADFTKMTDAKREQAMAGLRNGTIKVAIGGTDTLGTGVNAQDRLVALHHLDCPWRPSDLEQRDGRGWRHGNQNKSIQIHRYVTEGSLDEMLWSIIGRKAAFIKQVMTNGSKVARVAADEDTEELTPEQISAAASGDPRILERVQLVQDVGNLDNARIRHEREQKKFADVVRNADAVGKRHRDRADDYADAMKTLADNPDFHFTIDGVKHTERPAAEDALQLAASRAAAMNRYHAVLGNYRGLNVVRTNDGVQLETPGGAHVSTGGSLQSVEAQARKLGTRKEQAENDLAQHERDLAQVKAKLGKAFAGEKELGEKRERLKALEAEISGKKDEPKADAEGESVFGDGPAPAVESKPDYGVVLELLRAGKRKEAEKRLMNIGTAFGLGMSELKAIAQDLMEQSKA